MFRKLIAKIDKTLQIIVIGSIRGYQYCLSPWLGNRCRFSPSCSQYAIKAVKSRGFIVGVGLMVWRLLRCHPWCAGGYDPVPCCKEVKK